MNCKIRGIWVSGFWLVDLNLTTIEDFDLHVDEHFESHLVGNRLYITRITVILFYTTLWSLYIITHYYTYHSLLYHTSTDHSLFMHSLLYTEHSLVFYMIHGTLSVTLSITLYYTQITLDLCNIYHVRNTLYYFLSYTQHSLLHFLLHFLLHPIIHRPLSTYTISIIHCTLSITIYYTRNTLYSFLLYTEHFLLFSVIHDFNVSYSSCWGYSLINTLKLYTALCYTLY